MQELDLATGLVRYEWHSLDHVPLSDTYVSPRPGSLKEPFDFFHINAVEPMHDGSLLIDARNTWAAYDVDRRTGKVLWRLGGAPQQLQAGPGAVTAYQHDAREQPNGNITFFDNGATPKAHPQSRAIEVALNMHAMTATLVRRVEHSPALVAGSQGNTQALAGGAWMVGWGEEPWMTEYGSGGQVLFDAHLPGALGVLPRLPQRPGAGGPRRRRPSRSPGRARRRPSTRAGTAPRKWPPGACSRAAPPGCAAPGRERAAYGLRDRDRAAAGACGGAASSRSRRSTLAGAVLGASAARKG